MRKQLILIPLLVLALSLVLVWRVRAQNAYKHAPAGGSATIEGTATFVASRIGGRLVEVGAQEGDRVTKGQPVAKLDCVEPQALLEAARARVASAEAAVAAAEAGTRNASDTVAVAAAQVAAAQAAERVVQAERELTSRNKDRASALHGTGAISAVELENLETRLKGTDEQREVAVANVKTAAHRVAAARSGIGAARAQVEAARAAVDVARADLKRAQLGVSECTLVAPRDGVITARLLEPGSVVGPGTRVLTLVDVAVAKAVFFLPDAELARARIGAPAQVRVDAYPGRVFDGKVARIAAEAEFTPRNVQTREDRDRLVYAVEVRIDNADGALRAGMPAEVSLPGTAP
jgi:HlyD family secretion protein